MGAEQALADSFDLILIDDVCSFLTPRLVARLRERGRQVVGVFDPGDGPDAKRRLLECGITDVVESEAAPEEFLSAITATMAQGPQESPPPTTTGLARRIGVIGATRGVGTTEVAVALARALSITDPTILVDLDQEAPAVAQRLDLPPHPNLRTAVDLAHHERDRLPEALQWVGAMTVVSGYAAPRQQPLPSHEVAALLEDLTQHHRWLVADLGPADGADPAGLAIHSLLLVGSATPVGIGRLVRASTRVTGVLDTLLVVNRAPGSGRMRDDIEVELARLVPDRPTLLLSEDHRIARDAWDGRVVSRGRFARGIRAVADVLARSIDDH